MANQPDLAEITKAGTIVYWVCRRREISAAVMANPSLKIDSAVCTDFAGHLWNHDRLSRWLRGPHLAEALPRSEARL